MPLLKILTDPQDFKFYAGGKGYVSTSNTFGQKNIPYGKDRFGGGDSGQPFIKTPILEEPGKLAKLETEDFLLRGGVRAPLRALEDVVRLTKYISNPKSPSGLLFVLKQNLLSRVAAKPESIRKINPFNGGIYTPLSTLAQAGVGFAGIHLNKQGIDPTGLIPLLKLRKYESVIGKQDSENFEEDNRLVRTFIERQDIIPSSVFLTRKNNVLTYGGGPGSILGIGRTRIKFSSYRTGINNPISKTSYFNNPNKREVKLREPIGEDFRKKKLDDGAFDPKNKTTYLSTSPDYKTKNIEKRLNFVDPGQPGDIKDYKVGKLSSITPFSPLGPSDRINAIPLYKSTAASSDDVTNDLIRFRIAIIDPTNPSQKTFIHFRAFIDSFSDSYKASWKGQSYMGRAEEFHKYGGFDRSISISFTVAAQSKEELIPIHKKLNFLASSLAPTYTNSGYMAGNMSQLTVGGYLFEQPGIINSVNLKVPNSSPWEIAIDTKGEEDTTVNQLPHMINVSISFTPIHTFRPSINGNNRTKLMGNIKKENNNFKDDNAYGDQNYIALSSTEGVNKYTTPSSASANDQPASPTLESQNILPTIPLSQIETTP